MLLITKNFRSRHEGQALVEFALIFPILLIILFTGFEFGFVSLQSSRVSSAARDAARMGAVTSPFNSTVVQNGARTLLLNAGFKEADIVSIGVNFTEPNITVTIQVRYHSITGGLITGYVPKLSTLILTGKTVMRWEG